MESKYSDSLNQYELKYSPYGEYSILIEWPQIISEDILKSVLFFSKKIKTYYFKEKVYIKSAYNSILVSYDINIDNIYNRILALKSIYLIDFEDVNMDSKLWKIPVCYDTEFGLDLEDISLKNNLQISKIIQLHTKVDYLVYFIGFLPGFLYLGGLDKRLHFPRKSTPRLKIKKGAVAIGGSQTGIYPNESPGGWNIIGNTPVDFFSVTSKKPCFANPGDKIQFELVSKNEYDQILTKVENGTYHIKSEVVYD